MLLFRLWFLAPFGSVCGSLGSVCSVGTAALCLAVGWTLAEVAHRREVKQKAKRFELRNIGCVFRKRDSVVPSTKKTCFRSSANAPSGGGSRRPVEQEESQGIRLQNVRRHVSHGNVTSWRIFGFIFSNTVRNVSWPNKRAANCARRAPRNVCKSFCRIFRCCPIQA
jgi:hypothetical protein